MKVIVDRESGNITRVISNSIVSQILKVNEIEITVEDPEIIDAFNRGEEILYNKDTGEIYYEPQTEIDPEKVALYEVVANLFEEVQALKEQIGGIK